MGTVTGFSAQVAPSGKNGDCHRLFVAWSPHPPRPATLGPGHTTKPRASRVRCAYHPGTHSVPYIPHVARCETPRPAATTKHGLVEGRRKHGLRTPKSPLPGQTTPIFIAFQSVGTLRNGYSENKQGPVPFPHIILERSEESHIAGVETPHPAWRSR